MIYARNSLHVAEPTQIAPPGPGATPALFLQLRQQLGELAEEAQLGASANRILSARRWQNEYHRTVQALLLKSQLAGSLRKVLIGGLAVEGDHLRRILLQLLRQHDAA